MLLLTRVAKVTGVDISFHMLPDDIPENFEPQVRRITSSLFGMVAFKVSSRAVENI